MKHDMPLMARGRIRRGFQAPLVMGALTADPDHPDDYPYNTALMLDAQGNVTAKFDKIFLLMFGEYIPGLETFPWLRKVMPKAAGQLHRGKGTTTFPFEHDGQTYRLGPMICYEDILPTFGRKLAALHPHLLVNITNDAWFGDTSEPWEHLALSVYRSVELRTGLVRAVNTGVSAFVDATGNVYAKTYANDPAKHPIGADKAIADVALLAGGYTVYSVVGDLFGWLNALATALLWIVLPRLTARRRSSAART
jgi:apolipoprotein N-acyltransferase